MHVSLLALGLGSSIFAHMTASFLREDGGVSQLRAPASASLLLYELQSYVVQGHPQKRELYT